MAEVVTFASDLAVMSWPACLPESVESG